MEELTFAAPEDALQHLADLTGKQVKIAGVTNKDELKRLAKRLEDIFLTQAYLEKTIKRLDYDDGVVNALGNLDSAINALISALIVTAQSYVQGTVEDLAGPRVEPKEQTSLQKEQEELKSFIDDLQAMVQGQQQDEASI